MDKALQKVVAFIAKAKVKLQNIGDIDAYNCLVSIEHTLCAGNTLEGDVEHLICSFNVIETLVEDAGLTYHEKCNLARKVVEMNFSIIQAENTLYINYEQYKDLFVNYGINNSVTLQKYLTIYLNDENTDELSLDIKNMFHELVLNETKKGEYIKGEYIKIKAFSVKDKTDEDFKEIVEPLKNIGLPNSLIEYYLAYYRKNNIKNSNKFIVNKEEKKNVQETTYTKKELKTELALYCDLKSEKPFDYANYDRVLWLLAKLQYADNINDGFFRYCETNKIENEAYYRYFFMKIKDNKRYEGLIEDIKWYVDNIGSEEDLLVAKEEITNMLDKAIEDYKENFDYEYMIMKKVRGGING